MLQNIGEGGGTRTLPLGAHEQRARVPCLALPLEGLGASHTRQSQSTRVRAHPLAAMPTHTLQLVFSV
jgi:hypothetical protein